MKLIFTKCLIFKPNFSARIKEFLKRGFARAIDLNLVAKGKTQYYDFVVRSALSNQLLPLESHTVL